MRSEKWTIKSPLSGEVVAEFVIEAQEVPVAEAARSEPAKPAMSNNGDEKMSEPQRRYLFRLLAAQKVTGKAAEDRLKTYFKVRALGDITRPAASEYIDQLVKDKKDAPA